MWNIICVGGHQGIIGHIIIGINILNEVYIYMEFNKNIDCYVINLDKRTDRLNNFDTHLDNIGL